MLNENALREKWTEFKGQIRSKWGQLTDDDLKSFDGNADRLMSLIERKTGQSRQAIEGYLENLTSAGRSAAGQISHTALSDEGANRIQQATNYAADKWEEGSEWVQDLREGGEQAIRRHPAESALVCFGVGVLAGFLLGDLLVDQTAASESRWMSHPKSSLDRFANQIAEAMTKSLPAQLSRHFA